MQQLFRNILIAVGCCLLTEACATEVGDDPPLQVLTPRSVSQALYQSDDPPAPPIIAQQRTAETSENSENTSSIAKLPLLKLPSRRADPASMTMRSPSELQASNQTRQALYGRSLARPALDDPRRTSIPPSPQQLMRQPLKPFHTVYRDPTISPYLNLFREEDDSESAPNYFAFVRPQLDQIEANHAQQGELRQLARQLQRRSTTVAAPHHRAAGPPGARTPARYMDTAQFYGGWSQ